jgi:glycosyltransferase involved in cell wall biosynthesis
MRLLIVVPGQDPATGNWVTATRLAQGLGARGHVVSLAAVGEDGAALRTAITAADPDLALLLHAWRSGRPWLASAAALPYAVLLTGTDINAGISDPAQAPVIAAVLDRAAAILAQDPAIVETLRAHWPARAPRVHFLPPGISLGNAPYPLRDQVNIAGDERLLLCPAGIRPVKGVVELLELCDPLAGEGYRFRLLFCGPVLDAGYGERFRAELATRPWGSYLGVVAPAAMPALLRQVDLVVSNSRSEGLPNALVEAATLGRPILASAISGNAAVVNPGCNGLLFRNRSDFQATLRSLLDDPARLRALSRPDPERFAPERESTALENLCQELLAGQHGVPAAAHLSA